MEKGVLSFINIQESLLAANHLFILISSFFTSEDRELYFYGTKRAL